MKSMYLLIFAAFVFGLSCSRKNAGDFVVIPVARYINETRGETPSADMVKNYRVIPLETSDSVLLGGGRIESVADDRIILTDNGTVYFFDPADGSLKGKFNRQGRGPGEYLWLGGLEIAPDGSNIYVSDFQNQNINLYSPEGRSLEQLVTDSISDLLVDKQGRFIASYRPFVGWRNLVGVYDANWNTLATFFDNPPLGNRVVTLWPSYSLDRFNGEPHIYLSDTLYHISPERVAPVLALDKGSLKAPEEVTLDFRLRDTEGHRYILGDYGRLAGSYYFLQFYYNQAMYFDLWNTSTGELMLRNVVTGPEGKYGIPFDLDRRIIYAWPTFVQDNKIYCLLGFEQYEQTKALYPEFAEDDNPVILEITL
jgi:hypothetical protein